ncbi:MAG TPA: nitrogen regulation protein NR(II) [Gammaproteobacteria bacterium]|nr:nitrogen regulation protein NR(II) [Gammaproteobacteria bacterium]
MKRKATSDADWAVRILDGQTVAVLVFSPGLRLTYLNPAAEMLFAHSARRALGLSLGELVVDADALEARMAQALNTGHPITEREVRLVLPEGGEVTVDFTVTPLMDPGQDPELLVELLRVDRHLRIAREETLIAQNHAARALVRGLAHEIKNPLGGLRGAAQLLERELEAPELKEYTRIIIGEADRLQTLMNRMLGPNTVPHRVRTNIHEILEHVRSLVQAEAGPGLDLQRDYDPSLPDMEADPDMLIQAALNIVRNAAQALEGKGTITLRTRALRQFTIGQQRHKLVARLDVIDNGPGIPRDIMEQMFYPMVTGRAEGTGLGLSIAQSLVNLHGGLIECVSRPGCTEFTILLPLERVDE